MPRTEPAKRLYCAVVLATVLGLGAAVAGPVLRAAELSRVAPLVRDGRVLVSFELADAYTDDVREAIGSGLATRFSYEIALKSEASLWFDRTVSETTVATEVRFDNLTRRYQLSRLHDGRVEEARVTEDEADVRLWMTRFERLPLFETHALEPNTEYYLRVRVHTTPRRTWRFFWPWGRAAASAVAKFTFLP